MLNEIEALSLHLSHNTREDPYIVLFSSELVSVFIVTLQARFVRETIDHHNVPVLSEA